MSSNVEQSKTDFFRINGVLPHVYASDVNFGDSSVRKEYVHTCTRATLVTTRVRKYAILRRRKTDHREAFYRRSNSRGFLDDPVFL